jgi:hypothetical protein
MQPCSVLAVLQAEHFVWAYDLEYLLLPHHVERGGRVSHLGMPPRLSFVEERSKDSAGDVDSVVELADS